MLLLGEPFLFEIGAKRFVSAVEPVDVDGLSEAGVARHVVVVVLFIRRQPREFVVAMVFQAAQVDESVPRPQRDDVRIEQQWALYRFRNKFTQLA